MNKSPVLKSVGIMLTFPKGEKVGGHFISAMQIAKEFSEQGTKVFLFANKKIDILSNLNDGNITVVQDSVTKRGVSGLLVRFFLLFKFFTFNKIDVLLTFDKISGYHAVLPAVLFRISLLQVIPAGNGEDFLHKPPLRTKKIISFSQEIKDMLIQNWGFLEEQIIVNSARFKFDKLKVNIQPEMNMLKIGYISGLRSDKLSSFTFFLDELQNMDSSGLKIDVIGDGPLNNIFQKKVSDLGIMNVNFVGLKTINQEFLSKYSLIVTMGRGVIESMAYCTPVAVCGHEGFKGLVTSDNLAKFEQTNFTGRRISESQTLNFTLQKLSNGNLLKELSNLCALSRSKYDVSNIIVLISKLAWNDRLVPSLSNLPIFKS